MLFRVNAQSEVYERALADAGVPYVLRGGERFFDRPEIREAMLLLRGAVRSAESGEKLADLVRDVLSALSWSAGSPPAGGSARERWESLAALVGVAEELAAMQPDAGLGDFLAELEQRAAAQHAPTVQGVTLASLHAAKGLEWDAVFLVGLVEGTLPIQHAVTDEQVDEERRLLYVGVTRARESLALSWALSRAPGGRRSRRRTRFLHGIAAGSGRGSGRAGAPPRHGRSCPTEPTRSCSADCGRGDRPGPRPRRCRRTWSSPTRRWPSSRCGSRPTCPSWWPCRASDSPNWTGTVRTCSRSSAASRRRPGPVADRLGRTGCPWLPQGAISREFRPWRVNPLRRVRTEA